jgi:hypothetical protein
VLSCCDRDSVSSTVNGGWQLGDENFCDDVRRRKTVNSFALCGETLMTGWMKFENYTCVAA